MRLAHRTVLAAHMRSAACELLNLAPAVAARSGPWRGGDPAVARRHYPRGEDVIITRGLHKRVASVRPAIEGYTAAHPPEHPRVVFLLNTVHRVGGVLSVVQLANDLRALGCETDVVARSNNRFTRGLGFDPEPLFFRDAGDLIDRFPEADIVVATLWSTAYLMGELFERRRSFLPAYFVQDYEPAFVQGSPDLAELARASYALTPYAFAKTPWIRDRVREAGGKIALVPPALDLGRFTPAAEPAAPTGGKRVILTMLRPNTPRRGFETAAAVLTRLADARDDVELHAFGTENAELDGYELPFPLTNHGRVPNEELPALYRRAFCFLECSDFHGFGRTVAEALACGVPVVATRSGGVESFARDGENALLAPVKDADALASNVIALLDDPARRTALAANARASVEPFERMNSARATLDTLRGFMSGQAPD